MIACLGVIPLGSEAGAAALSDGLTDFINNRMHYVRHCLLCFPR